MVLRLVLVGCLLIVWCPAPAALADEIPGAKMLLLHRAGHGLDPMDWETVADAILDHTSRPIAGATTARRRV